MRSLLSYCLLAAAAVIPSTLATPLRRGNPVIVTPGPPQDTKITKYNTLNGTFPNSTHSNIDIATATATLPINIANHFSGSQLYAYVAALDPNGKVVMLQPNGQWYYPTSTSTTTPQPITANVALTIGGQGSTTTFTLPTYMSSGRVYISEGELTFSTLETPNGVTLVQPDFNNPSDSSANKDWTFMELTNTSGGLYADLSFVDFVGLPLGMTMTTSSGSTTVKGVNSGAVGTICSGLSKYASSDNAPWDQLCQYLSNGQPLRAVAPQKYIAVHSSAFQDYYTDYVSQVWNHYSNNPLTIDSQTGTGEFNCQVSGSTMNCNGGSRGFSQPGALDIFGCQGQFATTGSDNAVILAAVPRLCAAFDRTTLLLNGGNVQPSLSASNYYTQSPTNRYSQLVHSVELDGRGYAFPYDDVTPDGAPNQSGTLVSNDAQSLTLTVGGN